MKIISGCDNKVLQVLKIVKREIETATARKEMGEMPRLKANSPPR